MLVDYSLLIHAQRLRVNRSPAWPGVEESTQGVDFPARLRRENNAAWPL